MGRKTEYRALQNTLQAAALSHSRVNPLIITAYFHQEECERDKEQEPTIVTLEFSNRKQFLFYKRTYGSSMDACQKMINDAYNHLKEMLGGSFDVIHHGGATPERAEPEEVLRGFDNYNFRIYPNAKFQKALRIHKDEAGKRARQYLSLRY
jgi:hypothetical protein